MSVINQMLKDLAKRSKPTVNSHIVLSGLNLQESRAINASKLTIFILILLSFVILFVIGLLIVSKNVQPVLVKKNIITIPEPISPSLVTLTNHLETFEQKAMLSGLALESKNDMTNFRLFLNHNILYRLGSSTNNTIRIILEKTELASDLPKIDTMNSAIHQVSMQNLKNGNLEILLKLKPGAELKAVELSPKDKFSEMHFDIAYLANPEPLEHEVHEEISEDPILANVAVKKYNYDTSTHDNYKKALALLEQGQSDEALVLLNEIIDQDPNFILPRKMLVSLYLSQGDIEKATQLVNIGLDRKPFHPDLVLLKAQILVDKGDVNSALSLLNTAPPPLSDNPEYHAFIAGLYQSLHKNDLSKALYQQLVKADPENSVWWMGLGISLEELNKKPEALVAYKKAKTTNHLNPELRNYLETRIQSL